MDGQEFIEARESLGLSRGEFAALLGYQGNPRSGNRNARTTIIRYESGLRDIPPMVERLVRMLVWFKDDFGYLPDLDAGERVPMAIPDIFQETTE